MAYKRHKMDRSANRRTFRKGTGVHRKNMGPPVGNPMRGGIRL